MAKLLSRNTIDRIEEALQSCIEEMKSVNEPCDHKVGICWCSYHTAMRRAENAMWLIKQVTK